MRRQRQRPTDAALAPVAFVTMPEIEIKRVAEAGQIAHRAGEISAFCAGAGRAMVIGAQRHIPRSGASDGEIKHGTGWRGTRQQRPFQLGNERVLQQQLEMIL
ncbi:hypothetical protein CKO12_10780 [Chromatium okenii]|nr:hypothetical protein [Chromatium okenii]